MPSCKSGGKKLPLYQVVVHNDDHHAFEGVVAVLMRVTGCSEAAAVFYAGQIHANGKAAVARTHKELAELYQVRIQFLGSAVDVEDFGRPLHVSVEPVFHGFS